MQLIKTYCTSFYARNCGICATKCVEDMLCVECTWNTTGLARFNHYHKWGAVVYWVAHSLSDPPVMGSNPSTAYFHIMVHQPSVS